MFPHSCPKITAYPVPHSTAPHDPGSVSRPSRLWDFGLESAHRLSLLLLFRHHGALTDRLLLHAIGNSPLVSFHRRPTTFTASLLFDDHLWPCISIFSVHINIVQVPRRWKKHSEKKTSKSQTRLENHFHWQHVGTSPLPIGQHEPTEPRQLSWIRDWQPFSFPPATKVQKGVSDACRTGVTCAVGKPL